MAKDVDFICINRYHEPMKAMNKMNNPRWYNRFGIHPFWVAGIGLLLLVGLLFMVPGKSQGARPTGGTAVVVLTASWCGTCREVTPVVQRVIGTSSQPGIQLVMLDVDSNSAQDTAEQYGVSISGTDIPQVYLVHQGRTTLLFNGKDYHFGQSKQAEQQIRSQLEANL